MTNEENVAVRTAAAAMGRVKSEKKAAAARENKRRALAEGKDAGGRPLKPLADFACTCGGCPEAPKTNCPRGRAILRRKEKGLPFK